jgi:hypothetical protein
MGYVHIMTECEIKMTNSQLIRLVSKLDARANQHDQRGSDDGYSTARGLRIASEIVMEMIENEEEGHC